MHKLVVFPDTWRAMCLRLEVQRGDFYKHFIPVGSVAGKFSALERQGDEGAEVGAGNGFRKGKA